MKYLQRFIEQNSTDDLLIACGLFILTFTLLYFARMILVSKLSQWSQRSSTLWDDILADVVARTHSLMLAGIALLSD